MSGFFRLLTHGQLCPPLPARSWLGDGKARLLLALAEVSDDTTSAQWLALFEHKDTETSVALVRTLLAFLGRAASDSRLDSPELVAHVDALLRHVGLELPACGLPWTDLIRVDESPLQGSHWVFAGLYFALQQAREDDGSGELRVLDADAYRACVALLDAQLDVPDVVAHHDEDAVYDEASAASVGDEVEERIQVMHHLLGVWTELLHRVQPRATRALLGSAPVVLSRAGSFMQVRLQVDADGTVVSAGSRSWASAQSDRRARAMVEALREALGEDEAQSTSDMVSQLFPRLVKLHEERMEAREDDEYAWKKCPTTRYAIVSALLHVEHPHLSPLLTLGLPYVLRLLDDYEMTNKLLGALALLHMVRESDPTHLRRQAAPVMRSLRVCLTFREVDFMRALMPLVVEATSVLFSIRRAKPDEFWELFKLVLQELEYQALGSVREPVKVQLLLRAVQMLLLFVGLEAVPHMADLLPILLACSRRFQDSGTHVLVLEAFGVLIRTCQPRMGAHSGKLVESVGYIVLRNKGNDASVDDAARTLLADMKVLLPNSAPKVIEEVAAGVPELNTVL